MTATAVDAWRSGLVFAVAAAVYVVGEIAHHLHHRKDRHR